MEVVRGRSLEEEEAPSALLSSPFFSSFVKVVKYFLKLPPSSSLEKEKGFFLLFLRLLLADVVTHLNFL